MTKTHVPSMKKDHLEYIQRCLPKEKRLKPLGSGIELPVDQTVHKGRLGADSHLRIWLATSSLAQEGIEFENGLQTWIHANMSLIERRPSTALR